MNDKVDLSSGFPAQHKKNGKMPQLHKGQCGLNAWPEFLLL